MYCVGDVGRLKPHVSPPDFFTRGVNERGGGPSHESEIPLQFPSDTLRIARFILAPPSRGRSEIGLRSQGKWDPAADVGTGYRTVAATAKASSRINVHESWSCL